MCLKFPVLPDKLTPAEQRLLEFIEGNWEEFLFFSIGRFSERTGISEATISRFARHLGCRDFKNLKTVVMQQKQMEGPAAKMAGTLSGEDFRAGNYLEKQKRCLQKTMEQMEEREFEQAAAEICRAKHVFIHAKSASSSMGELLRFRLQRMGLSVTKLPSAGSELLESLAQLESDDIIICFGFSKTSRERRVILDYRREAGYKTILFSSRLYLPREDQADVNLYVYRGEDMEYHSMTTAAALIDALVIAVSGKLGKKATDQLQKIYRLKKNYRKASGI